MSPANQHESVVAICDLMRQRGIEAQIYESRDPYTVGVESTSPLGEGRVWFQEVMMPRDPWVLVPPNPARMSMYRPQYSGDGDWMRLSQEAGLDGLLAALRTEYALLLDMSDPEDLFGDLGALSSEVLVSVAAVDEDKPILESSHVVHVHLGNTTFPPTYMLPPFGIHSLERMARQILLYADVPSFDYSCSAPECRNVMHIQMPQGGPRRRVLGLMKAHLCTPCLEQVTEQGREAALPRAPKGWDK